MTPKGRRLLEACETEVAGLEERMMQGLSAQERRSLRRALLECVHSLDGGLIGR